MKLSFFTFTVLLFTLFFSFQLLAQVPPPEAPLLFLTLSNGDQISGKFVSTDQGNLLIENKYAGKFPIPVAEIKSWKTEDVAVRETLTKFFALTPIEKATVATLVAVPEKTATAKKEAVTTVAALAVKAAKPATKPESWKRQVNLAYKMTRGNIKSSDLNAVFQVSRKKGTRRIAMNTFLRQGVNNGRQSANLFTSTFRYERTLFRLPVFNEAQFEIDKLKKLNYRFSENAGLSWPVLKGDTRQLSFDFGTGITKESYENGLEKLNATSLLRLSASQKLATKTVLQQQATFFSDLTDPGAYRFQTEASFTTPITKHVALRLSGINRYDAHPQGQVKPNDFTLLTGFTFDF